MKTRNSGSLPEKLVYTKYYEHDGALRAYSNRMLWFGIAAIGIAFTLTILFFWVRVQPPLVIHISEKGEATVVGASPVSARPAELVRALAAGKPAVEEPTDIEGRAVVRKFLENYLIYTPSTVEKNWADALNMMTGNLRTLTLAQLRDQDIVSKVQEDAITSAFRVRSIESIKGQPWTYLAFGVKEVHRIHNKLESTDRIVAQYHIRLLQTDRSERVPSGLLVAEYGEHQMVGEKDNGLSQASMLIGDGKN
ncbi:MAG: hypothetical protein JOZ62_01375 [Acidobacteriaceae bacterium]|nr:hypothetical protein [Acidobacteriaceae bacterium]